MPFDSTVNSAIKLRPLLGLSKSGLIGGMVLILNIEYGQFPDIMDTLYHTVLLALNLLFMQLFFFKYLVEWQTM